MNSLNALGNRQVASLQADLGRMEAGEGGPSVQGEYTTGRGAMVAMCKHALAVGSSACAIVMDAGQRSG